MDSLIAKVPLQVRLQEWRHHPAGGTIDVQRHIETRLGVESVQRGCEIGDRFVAAGVGDAEDADDANGVLVDVWQH